MSPTFSEPMRRARRRDDTRYRRAVWLTGLVALVATAIALVVYALQGPRLRFASIDVVRAVAVPEVVLALESDRPLAPLDATDVTVLPETPIRVDVSGTIVSIVFEQPLRYGTQYQVTINGVTGAARDIDGTWTHSFATPAANFYYLDRGSPGQPDRIMRAGTQGLAPTEVYSGDRIDSFVTIGSTVVVASPDSNDTSRLDVIEPIGGDSQRLVVPEGTRIDQLVAPASGTSALFTASSVDESGPYDRTLFVVDVAGSPRAQPVTGLDGQTLRVTKVAPVPGSSRVLAWVDDIRVVSIDLTTGLVLPLAEEAQEFWGVSSNGREVIIVDVGGTVAINIDTLEEQRLIPGLIGTREVFEGQTHLLGDSRRIQTVVLGNQTGTEFTSFVSLDDGQGSSQPLYRTPGDQGSIGRFVVSPGDQYVAVEVVPNRQTAVSDQRPLEPRDLSVMTVIVDIDSGQVVRSVEGFWPIW